MQKADQIEAGGGEGSILLVCLFIYLYLFCVLQCWHPGERDAASPDCWLAEPRGWCHRQPLRIHLSVLLRSKILRSSLAVRQLARHLGRNCVMCFVLLVSHVYV